MRRKEGRRVKGRKEGVKRDEGGRKEKGKRGEEGGRREEDKTVKGRG